MSERVRPKLRVPSSVLITESAERFERLHDAFDDELKPRGPLERIIVDGIAENAWDICRLNRVKTGVINAALRPGLEQLLQSLMPQIAGEMDLLQWLREINRLADQFGDESDKKEVLEILEWFKLDESAIEATAVQYAARNLERIDRLIASQELRLSNALSLLADLRGGLGRQLHGKVERIIEGKVLALDDASKKKSPPTAA